MAQTGLGGAIGGGIGIGISKGLLAGCILWPAVIALSFFGLQWASSALEGKRFNLREIFAFVAYWAIVSAFAAAMLNR